MAVPTHPGTSREGLATPGLLSDAGSPERQWAKHPLPLLVWVHLCKLSQWPQTYKREGREEGGGVSGSYGGKPWTKTPLGKRARVTWRQTVPADFWPHWWGLWLRSGCRISSVPWELPVLCRQSQAPGQRRWATWPQAGWSNPSWGSLSSRKPCPPQITEALCYAQRLFYFYYPGISFPKQTFANAERKTGW